MAHIPNMIYPNWPRKLRNDVKTRESDYNLRHEEAQLLGDQVTSTKLKEVADAASKVIKELEFCIEHLKKLCNHTDQHLGAEYEGIETWKRVETSSFNEFHNKAREEEQEQERQRQEEERRRQQQGQQGPA